jgi:quercetin dioxygenase-like cupin family protein
MPENHITTHNETGEAVFTTSIPTRRHQIPLFPGGGLALGSLQCIYYSNHFNSDLSSGNDLEEYALIRTTGLPLGQYAPFNGVIINVVTMASGWESPWHQTSTLDVLVVIEGNVELHLDGGECRNLKEGDYVVQRATNHRWKNVTPNGGSVRMFAVSQPVQSPPTQDR